MKSKAIILFSGFLSFSAPSLQPALASSLGHYSTGVIPKSYGSCDALKAKISSAFVSATDVDLVSTECSSNSHGSTVTLNYVDNSKPVEFNTTRGRSVTDDIAGRGYIKTLQECESRKASVVEKFTTATGLQPFLVYCMEDEAANTSTHPWHVAIEAAGAGAMTYQYMDRMLSEGLSTDPTALTDEIKQYFTSRPETLLVDVVYRMDSLGFARIGLAVFAKKYVSINKYEFLATRREQDCTFEADELKQAAIRAGMPVVGHGCQFRTSDPSKTFLITETRAKLSFDRSGISFENMEACRSARSNVFEDMKAKIGDSVVGIHCSDTFDGPTAYVIFKPEA
jgi:hypothetical protein